MPSNSNKSSSGKNPLFILYGSATGNSEHIAKDLSARFLAHQQQQQSITPPVFDGVVCCELDQFKKKCLPVWETEPIANNSKKYGVLIIVSTTGNGDPPENAGRFVRHMKRQQAAAAPLQHCTYAVLGLGDTNYDQFCACGKLIDRKLAELGGTRLKPISCADEATGLEDVVEPWTDSILTEIALACQPAGESGGERTTVLSSVIADLVIEDEKKTPEGPLVVDSSSASSMANGGPSTTTTATNSAMASTGVHIIKSLLKKMEDESSTSSNNKNSISLLYQNVDPRTLPPLLNSRSSCELVDRCISDNTRWESAVASHVEDTVSSVSSGYHYTLNNPYESHILQARYLTQTPVLSRSVGMEACTTTTTATGEELQRLEKITQAIDKAYPLKDDTDPKKAERNGKRVLELTLQLPDDQTLEYAPGDALGLVVENTGEAVEFVLDLLHRHHGVESDQPVSVDGSPDTVTVEQLLRHQIDLSTAPCCRTSTTNKRLLHALSQLATDPDEQGCLQLLASKCEVGERLFALTVDEQRWNVVDLLRAFPSTQPNLTLTALLGILPRGLPPRYYSVTSSPLLVSENSKTNHADSVVSLTIAFSVVDYLTPSLTVVHDDGTTREVGQRRIRGIATRYLEALAVPLLVASKDKHNSNSIPLPAVRIFPKPTTEFRMPGDLTQPLILIGPGTGIAPFLGFLQHRQCLLQHDERSNRAAQTVVQGAWRGGFELEEHDIHVSRHDGSGLNVGADYSSRQRHGSVDVFFGCRHRDHDWLYRDELQTLVQIGIVTRLHTAFSRDPDAPHKYVQDIMVDESCAERIVDLLLRKNAAVYVCGDGNAMAKDVQNTLVKLLAERGCSGGRDEAQKYLEHMKKTQRFLLDIWS